MSESKDAPVEGHTVLPENESLLPELPAEHERVEQVAVLDNALEPERGEQPKQDQIEAACSPAPTSAEQPLDDRTLAANGQPTPFRRVERCPTPAWCQDSDRPQSPGKRKLPAVIGFVAEDEKRRRVEGTKTPLEELSEFNSRAPEQFAASPVMQPFGGAFEPCGNMDDGSQDFGADGFDSDSMDSDESDSSLPSDEESDSEVDSDSAEWFESGPARMDEEICRKSWNQHVYASKGQCWEKSRIGAPAADSCGKPNCSCGDELYFRRRNAYHRRRQVVFNLSVSKLGRYRQAANPSLLRSVLVCNTLRNLEKEFEKEGVRFSVGAHGNLVITRSCPPNNRAGGNCTGNRPMPTWSQRRMMRQAAQNQGVPPPAISQEGSQQHAAGYQWTGNNVRDCGNCGNCANCANQMRSSHCFQCGKPHNVCRNSCRSQDYRSHEGGWQSDYRQPDYDYWQRCRYRRPGFNRWPSPTPRYPADYKERIYRDYRDEYVEAPLGSRQNAPPQPHGGQGQQNLRGDSFQGYQSEGEWAQLQHSGQHLGGQGGATYNPRYPVRGDPRMATAQSKELGQAGLEDRYTTQKDPHASSVLFADLNEDSGRLTPFVAFRDEPLTDYDTVDRLLNSVSVLNFGKYS